MIKLKEISGKSFRSFEGPFSKSFPDSGLTLVNGINTDTGDSSGSGKTSFILAIQYLLGGCPFPAKSLQNWNTKEKMEVKGVFQDGDKEFIITRGAGLKLEINGKPIKGGSKIIESKIDDLFGMDSKLRTVMTYRGQKKPGMFLSSANADLNSFLSKLLDLQIFEQVASEASKKAKDLKNSIIPITEKIKIYQDQIEFKENKIIDLELQLKDLDILEKELSKKEPQLDKIKIKQESALKTVKEAQLLIDKEIKEEIDSLQTKILQNTFSDPKVKENQELLNNVFKELENLKTEDRKKLKDHQDLKNELIRNVSELEQLEDLIRLTKKEILNLEKENEIILKNECPYCERDGWINDAASKKIINNEEKIKSKKELGKITLQEIKNKKVSRKKLEEFSKFVPNSEIPIKEKHIIELQKDIKDREVVIQQKRDDFLKSCKPSTQIKQEIENKYEIFDKLEKLNLIVEKYEEVNEYVSSLKLKIATISQIKEQVKDINSELRSLKLEENGYLCKLEQNEKQINAELDFVKLIGRDGFLGSIFDEVLATITHKVNDVLDHIANVQNVTIKFVSENETQAGKIQKKITPIVMINGQEAPLEAGLSGGMLTSVELAVDLAVSDVISNIRGVSPGFLILDESFHGLGNVSKETCMEVLQNFSNNRLILVIDHSSEFKSSFSQIIDIENSGGISVVN